jgi:uncharacterized protein (DUF1330 family)
MMERREAQMTSVSKLALAALLGAAVSGVTVYGLQAQSKKAYTVTELQNLDAKLAADVAPKIAAAQAKAGGHNFKTGGGKITAMEGTAPERVAITEWQSLAKAEAFFKSKAWTDLGPERDKALKTVRRYAVEER